MTASVSRVVLVGGRNENEFLRIFKEWHIPVDIVSLGEFLKVEPEEYTALFFMPGYSEWDKDLSFKYEILKMLKRFLDLNRGFYAEYIQADDYLLTDAFRFKQNYPPRPVGLERVFVSASHYITNDFPELAVLPVRNCSFLPGQRRASVLLAFATFLGTYRAFDLPPVISAGEGYADCGDYLSRDIWPALLSLEGKTPVAGKSGITFEENRRLFATFELSRFREKNFPLAHHWERLARRIVLHLLLPGERTRHERHLLPLNLEAARRRKQADAGLTASNREARYREALDRVMGWFLRSGVMRASDGTRGVYEGFRSHDHKLIPVLRSDCNAETALAFLLYGRLTGKRRYGKIAENIFAFLWKRGWQDRDRSHAAFGLWKFYDDFAPYAVRVYPNDNGEVGRALFLLHRYTGREQYRESALLTAEKFLQLRIHCKKTCLWGEEINRLGVKEYVRQMEKAGEYAGHLFHADPGILFLYAYQATKDKRYLDAVQATFTSRSPQDLFLLAFAFTVTGDRIYRVLLRKAVAKLAEEQMPCGAFLPSRQALKGIKMTNRFYGLAEVDVRHAIDEPITDQLYINSKAALNLYSAYYATGEARYNRMFLKVMDFLVKIQLHSADPRLDGAWMRAFDCKNWDYYGSNGDIDWGPYCIESGWSNSWTAIALALYLQKKSLIENIAV